MDKKICSKCSNEYEKTIEFFHRRKTSPDGFNTICKNCVKFSKPRKNKHWKEDKLLCLNCEIYKDICHFDNNSEKIHRKGKDSRCKECKKTCYENRKIERRKNSSLSRILTERFCGLRDRAKKNGMTVDFTKDYLQELWDRQEGLCAISKIKMTYEVFSGRISTNVSVDRKDSSIGYLKNNTQLVCMAINQMKNDLDIEQLLYFCKEIINNYEK